MICWVWLGSSLTSFLWLWLTLPNTQTQHFIYLFKQLYSFTCRKVPFILINLLILFQSLLWLQSACLFFINFTMNEQGWWIGILEENGKQFNRGRGAAAHNPQQRQRNRSQRNSIIFFHSSIKLFHFFLVAFVCCCGGI